MGTAWVAFKGLGLMGKLGVLLAILAAIGGIIFGVNRWLDGIRESGRNEVRAQWSIERAARADVKAEFQTAITAALQPQFDTLATKISSIDTTAAQISVKVPQAIAAAPRYRDPSCNLTPEVLDQVNTARGLSAAEPVQ